MQKLARGLSSVCLAFSLLLASAPLWAAINRGTIQGTVTDPQGAAIPSAVATITNVDMGVSQKISTNNAGFYFVPDLVPGSYRVHFEMAGFVPLEVTSVVVQANEVSRVDAQLQLGRAVQQIEVAAQVPLVETTAANFSASVQHKYVDDLPLLGRDVQSLVQLIPGATQSLGPPGSLVGFNSQFGGFPDATHVAGSLVAVNGSQGGANAWYLDGNLNAAQGVDNVVVNPSPDAVSEFQAVNNAFAAEYGRNAEAVFNVVLKSGTNVVHGDLYEYNRNSYFTARNPFEQLDPQGQDPFKRSVNWNQFGGTVGGPVYLPHLYNGKNRTFFFAAWDVSLLHETIPGVYTVPTVKQRADDLSENPNIAQFGIFDPMSTKFDKTTNLFRRQPFLNPDGTLATSIPTNRLDSVSLFYMSQFPLPNYLDPRQQNPANGGCLNLCNNFKGDVGSGQTTHNISIKLDHQINEKNRSFAEWLAGPSYYKNFRLPWTGATAPVQGAAGGNPYEVFNQIAALGATSTPTSTLVNEFRFSFSRQPVLPEQNPDSLVNNSGVLQHLQGLNLPLAPPFEPVPVFGVGGLTPLGWGPPAWTNGLQVAEAFTLLDNVTKVLGKHTIKTGFMFRVDRTAYENNFPIGLNFGGALTGNPAAGGVGGSGLAQFLLGATDQGSNAGYFHWPYTSNHTWSFYVQDDFRLTPRFTLNLGFRYDIYKWFAEKNDAGSIFDFNAPNPQVPTRLGRLSYFTTKQHPDRLVFPALKNDVGPRLNFAYTPFGDQKTIIRGGIDLIATNGLTNAFGQQNGGVSLPGYDQTEYYTTDATHQGLDFQGVTPAFILSQGAPSLLSPPDPKTSDSQFVGGSIFTPTKPTHDASVGIWNLQVQRELAADFMVSVGYVGSKGSHLVGDQYRTLSYVPTALKLQYRLGLNAQVPTPNDLVSILGTTTSQANLLVQYPQYPGGVTNVVSYDGSSSYHALQLKVEKHPSHGLGVMIAYAAQKTIASQNLGGYFANLVLPTVVSRGSRIGSVAGALSGSAFSRGGGGAQNRDNLAADRALSPDDTPQILNVAWTYELPLGPGKQFASGASGISRIMAEGWEISGNFNAQSGIPLQITGPCNDLTCRPNLVGNPAQGRSGKSRVQIEDQWFNPNAFEPVFGSDPTVLADLLSGTNLNRDEFWRFGTAGLRLPGARSPAFWNVDFGLLKNFKLSESKYFQFRWEVYNALNHQNLGLPNTGWCLPPNPDGSFDGIVRQFGCQFGRITNVQTDPRNMQFGLKFVF